MLIQRIDIIIGVKSRREKVLLLEGRNEKCIAASLDARGGGGGRGPTNQFRPTAFSSSPLLRPREGRKFKQMKSWSLLQGGTNLSEENSGQRSIEEESNTIKLSGSIRISMELFVPLS